MEEYTLYVRPGGRLVAYPGDRIPGDRSVAFDAPEGWGVVLLRAGLARHAGGKLFLAGTPRAVQEALA